MIYETVWYKGACVMPIHLAYILRDISSAYVHHKHDVNRGLGSCFAISRASFSAMGFSYIGCRGSTIINGTWCVVNPIADFALGTRNLKGMSIIKKGYAGQEGL